MEPIFYWSGIDATGQLHKGYVTAQSRTHAKKLLAARGVAAVSCYWSWVTVSNLAWWRCQWYRMQEKRLSLRQQALWCRNMAFLLRTEVSLGTSLSVTAFHMHAFARDRRYRTVQEAVRQGQSLAVALESQPGFFSPLIIHALYKVPTSKLLAAVLDELASSLDRQDQLVCDVWFAMSVPLITVLAAAAIVALAITFMVPLFVSLQGGQEAATGSAIVILAEHCLWWGGVLLGGSFCGAIVLFIGCALLPCVRWWCDRLWYQLPVSGPLYQCMIVIPWLQALAVQLRAGRSLVDALIIGKQLHGNRYWIWWQEWCLHQLHEGKQFKDIILQLPDHCVPWQIVAALACAQEGHLLGSICMQAAERLTSVVRARIGLLLRLAQPLAVSIIAIGIGAVLYALYMPLLSVFSGFD